MKGKKDRTSQDHVRPWSIGKCPTGEDLRQAWAARRRSPKDFIWLLSVLGELTCFMDYSLEHKGGFGNIAGRRGGLKEFVAREAPELRAKYKSISRYAGLAQRIKQAFDIYPPAALSLLHPDLPLPRINMPFVTNHCRKVFSDHLADLPPQWKAFDARVRDWQSRRKGPKHVWGPPWPQDEWAQVERLWRRKYVWPNAFREIKAHHSFYARDYQRKNPGGADIETD